MANGSTVRAFVLFDAVGVRDRPDGTNAPGDPVVPEGSYGSVGPDMVFLSYVLDDRVVGFASSDVPGSITVDVPLSEE